MARLKTFVKNVKIDFAQKAHNCKHSKAHRIQRGDKRVGVKEGRSTQYYCVACASMSLKADIERLEQLRAEVGAEATAELG